MKNFALRLPPELFEAVKKAADKNYRSINNEIIFCLSQFHMIEEDEPVQETYRAPASGSEPETYEETHEDIDMDSEGGGFASRSIN